MRLLLVNDDGINAKGLHALAKELEKYYEITIVAPDSEKSACGHSITISRPLLVKKVKLEGINSNAYSVTGTPADCVRIGMVKLVEKDIDMVVSGINIGANLGNDILYSGTVSAAIEAAINNIPSLAVSVQADKTFKKFSTAARYARKVLNLAQKNNSYNDVVLNVNVPGLAQKDIKGIKICRIGGRVYNHNYEKIKNSNEAARFILNGQINELHENDTDVHFLRAGYVTLTPLHYDLTNFKILRDVEKWIK
ncbi:5'-nucleotidase SurE [Clostridium pasteurianum DSM 525 = ATCC 6013]|uniref:5'-nucleotidase SurE n=1 Tax=Clostridium pasteurianum DSM 525 = ATCC 6013 TaxID=1262449 RepID=A0A0H3JA82_CLOPA|nr:5'/3'-nucleotidase SurE [Clostridium pasteurianum]AJA49323.1 5'-nucleotidase SurE [Clostridium pasteurianum DSM 525 = ATCC 6013]AJA53311.1 5'-nucleotidase SurE [Clostridium pasteurianum DSM 525 = ATCC 6013]AOZ76499.1 stationary phase survival protein SurE [Clostridium pasteurianum DSM 525 = ATCC 6013]AOZ80296.1 stationary phase survival protein SurE [Clostridium pasteurianum]ELP58343.1 stationary phase survival protein SurE [Clostridium pasteurianum DSM 525 = ATCC 6013]